MEQFKKWPSLGLDRSNYDAWASATWAFSVPLMLGLGLAAHSSPESALGLAAPGLVLGPYHLAKAWRWHKTSPAARVGVDHMKMSALAEWVRRNPGYVYFGQGFAWGRDEAAKAYELEYKGFTGFPKKRLRRKQAKQLQAQSYLPWLQSLGKPLEVIHSLKDLSGHMIIYGTTGAGKTRLLHLLTAQAMMRVPREAVLVIDPKGDKDLRNCLKSTCEFLGEPERFVMFHPGFPEESIRINPLNNYTRGTELASRIASLIPSETGGDPFTAFSTMVLTALINGMSIIGEKVTLAAINSYMANGVDDMVMRVLVKYSELKMPDWEKMARDYTKKTYNDNSEGKGKRGKKGQRSRTDAMVEFYREVVRKSAPSADIDALLGYYERDYEHTQKMVTSLMPVLSSLTAGDMGPLLSPDGDADDERDIGDLSRLIERGAVIYMGLDTLPDQTVGSAVGSMVMGDLAAFAGDRYNYGEGNAPVSVFIDEMAEVINEPLIRVLNKSRAAGVSVSLAGQSYPEIVKRMGSEAGAQQGVANTNTTLALRLRDSKTKKQVSDGFPMVPLPQASRGVQAKVEPMNGSSILRRTGGRITQSWSMKDGSLVSASWLGALPNFEYFAELGGRMVKGKIPILDAA